VAGAELAHRGRVRIGAHLVGDDADLLDGQLEMEANDTVFVADAGSFIFVPREAPHRFKNISNTPTRLLFLFFPGGFEQFFLDIGNPVIEGQEKPSAVQYEPDVMRVAAEYGMRAV